MARRCPPSIYSLSMIEGAPERPPPQIDSALRADATARTIDPDQEQDGDVRQSHGKWHCDASAPNAGSDQSCGFDEVPPLGTTSQISPRATKTSISARNAVLRKVTARKASTRDKCMARLAGLRSPMGNSPMLSLFRFRSEIPGQERPSPRR